MGMKRRLCNGTLYKILIGKVAASFPNNNLKDMSFRTERQCSEESPYRCYKLDFVTFSISNFSTWSINIRHKLFFSGNSDPCFQIRFLFNSIHNFSAWSQMKKINNKSKSLNGKLSSIWPPEFRHFFKAHLILLLFNFKVIFPRSC